MRTLVWLVGVAAMLGLNPVTTVARSSKDPQQVKSFKRKLTRTVTSQYLLYLPGEYSARPRQRWPLILFLHGAGERGADISLVAIHGPPKLLKQGKDFPFIIVSPQCPANQRWDNDVLLALLDEIEAKYKVDRNRVY